MNSRTILRFKSAGDIWPIVNRWASQNGYKLKQSVGRECLFQKGIGFWVAPMMLKVKQENQETIIEAWVRANLFVRISSLFILPAEMEIASGGLKAVIPRNMARKAVNTLLAQLNQPPIP